MTAADTATKVEHKGYSRGLILGFTMAESMLLLVFCLLLVTGATIANERLKASTALKQVEKLEADLKKKEKGERRSADEDGRAFWTAQPGGQAQVGGRVAGAGRRA